ATKALQLSSEQVLRGDISNGDLARANLLSQYEARLDGEETVEGDRCWRLELAPKAQGERFSRIVGWISDKTVLPLKSAYDGRSGSLLKSARYLDYRKTPIGVRPTRLEIDTPDDMSRKTTMTFSNLRKIDASPLRFTPDGMLAFRDAAKAKKEGSGAAARTE